MMSLIVFACVSNASIASRCAWALARRAFRSTYCALTSVPVMCSLCTLPTFERSSIAASKCAAGTMKLMTPIRICAGWSAAGFAWASVPAM